MTDRTLLDALTAVLSLCESFGLRFQKIDLNDAPTLKAMADLLESQGLTGEILWANKDRVCLLKEFPCPADVLEVCREDIEAANPLPPIVRYELPPLPGTKGARTFYGALGKTPDEAEAEWQRQNPPAIGENEEGKVQP